MSGISAVRTYGRRLVMRSAVITAQRRLYVFLLTAGAVALLLVMLKSKADVSPLQLRVMVDTETFRPEDPVVITMALENISETPVFLPAIDRSIQTTYINVSVVHEQSGIPIFFVPPFEHGDRPVAGTRATSTEVLEPGMELVFTEIINETKIGFLGFTDPSNPRSVVSFVGRFSITATLVVNDENEPTGGDAAVFKGIVTSTESEPPASVTVTQLNTRCFGIDAMMVGSDTSDRIIGTAGDDVIVGLRGSDIIDGRGGNDRICGGKGNDKLRGGGGKDKLDGGQGNDKMNGGRGRDTCNGGPGADTARKCERVRGIL